MCVCVAKPVAVELRCHATALIVIFFLIFNFFFLNLAVFYIGENKKSQKYFFFLKCKNLGRRICKPRNKKKSPYICIGTTHPEDGLMKLKQMESSTGIWTMRCLLMVEPRHIIVIDKGNGVGIMYLQLFPYTS